MPDSEDPSFMRVSDGPAVNIEFVDSMSALGLAQICNIRSRNQLDLIFTDLDGEICLTISAPPERRLISSRVNWRIGFNKATAECIW